LLLVVDVQERLLHAVRFGRAYLSARRGWAHACSILKIPVLATEQNRLAWVRRPSRSAPRSESAPLRQDAVFLGHASSTSRDRIAGAAFDLLCGLESHVCVLQSALDLLEREHRVFVVRDAISSRFARDEEAALQRMQNAGAIVTTSESAILEMLGTADAPEFKGILNLIK
jgi:nicotinamidase-related amidase